MEIVLTTIFLLLLSIWVGYQEIAYSFAGLHVAEILSLKTFSTYLLLAILVGLMLMLLLPYQAGNFPIQKLYDLVTVILLTILVVNSLNLHTSMVMALWGAVGGMVYYYYPALGNYPFLSMIFSCLVVPLFSIPLTYLYYSWIERYAKQSDVHLLQRFYNIRQVAFVGVVLCGIALTYNYFLLFKPLLSVVCAHWSIGKFGVIVLLFLAAILCFFAVVNRVRTGYGTLMTINRHIASLYSLITVIILSIVASILCSLGIPVLVAANQVKECNNIFLDQEKKYIHLLNVGTISLLTPLLAFLLSMLMAMMIDDVYLKSATAVFIVMLSILAHLYFNQWRKHTLIKRVLSTEMHRKEEVSKEINRRDVLAVTSQFSVLSKEIDLKHRELINLSLYLRQQRDYLEDVGKRLLESARLDDIKEMRNEITQQANELRDNIKLSEEMDKIFTQVDEMHKNFVGRLKMRCPEISEREKRLAILLRLGYSSKEISSLMNIETKSVEIGRYRLRKKLKLERSVNIVQYLQLL